jgi:glycine cleavage system H lipoate-binding protein
MSKESSDDARVGVAKFTTNLLGKVEHIDVRGADRWVRQGQKLVTISGNGASIDLVSPIGARWSRRRCRTT